MTPQLFLKTLWSKKHGWTPPPPPVLDRDRGIGHGWRLPGTPIAKGTLFSFPSRGMMQAPSFDGFVPRGMEDPGVITQEEVGFIEPISSPLSERSSEELYFTPLGSSGPPSPLGNGFTGNFPQPSLVGPDPTSPQRGLTENTSQVVLGVSDPPPPRGG